MVILAATRPYADQLADLGQSIDQDLADARRQPLNLRVTNITTTTAKLQWDTIPGAAAYVSGRTGTDNRGNGVTALVDQPASTSRSFVWLKPGTTYTLFVLAVPSGDGQAITITTEH